MSSYDLEAVHSIAWGRNHEETAIESFSGFLRYDEACHIRRSDIQFHSSHLSLFIERSKTDIYCTGKTVLIARTNTDLCPVKSVLDYLHQAGIPKDSDYYIFRNVAFMRSTKSYILRPGNAPMSYSGTRELLLAKLQAIGLNKSDFGTHSLRAGGATAAAQNHMEKRLMMVHGRWVSQKSKDRYIQDTMQNRLKITLNLGL